MKHVYIKTHKTQIVRTPKEKAESIEEQIRRLNANKEVIPQNVPTIYTPREEGVKPEYDIRTDRFEIAYQAGDKYTASVLAKSADKGENPDKKPDDVA